MSNQQVVTWHLDSESITSWTNEQKRQKVLLHDRYICNEALSQCSRRQVKIYIGYCLWNRYHMREREESE